MTKRVILSTKLIIGQGTFQAEQITKTQALEWLAQDDVDNYHSHDTCRLIGLEPDTERRTCAGYDEALCLNTKKRLKFGIEYTLAQIEAIGIEYTLIRRRPPPAATTPHQAINNALIERIACTLTDENFPVEHLRALNTIVGLFNKSKGSEAAVFEFATRLKNRHWGR